MFISLINLYVPNTSKEGSKVKRSKIDKKNIFIVLSLIGIFTFAYILRYIPFMEYDIRLLTNWGDDWWFLGMARYFATRHYIPEVEPTYGNGIEYQYPPGLMLFFAVMTQITGVELVYLGRFVAVGLGALTTIFVYVLGKKLTKDYRVGLLAALLAASSVRYISRSGGFNSELFGHLLMPLILLFLYKGMKEKKDRNLLISGLLLAGLIISHHLSSAVMIVSLVFFSFLLLVFKRRKGFSEIKKVLFVLAIGLIISFPFWIKLATGGIMNIVVKEAYGREGFLTVKNFYKHLGIPQFFLGFAGIAYALYKRKTGHILLIAWAIPCILGLWDRDIATALFSDTLLKSNPDLLYVFSPSLYTRYFEYMTPAISILGAILFFGIFEFLGGIKKLKKYNISTILLAIGLFLVIISIPLPFNSSIFYEGSGYGWLKWAMVSFISTEEYEAAVWMRENLSEDVNILSDYEANEMILGVTALPVANGGTLRASLPVGTIYTEHLTIYFTPDLGEALRLINKYKVTHIFLSDRMIDKGWFAVERNARFNYEYGGNMHNADLDKFETSYCFKKIYEENKVRIYEVDYKCDEMISL